MRIIGRLFEHKRIGNFLSIIGTSLIIGASTVTLALAIVDFTPMYLVGLLRAISSHKIYISSANMH